MALVTKRDDAAGELIDAGARLTPAEAAKFAGGPLDAWLTELLAKATAH